MTGLALDTEVGGITEDTESTESRRRDVAVVAAITAVALVLRIVVLRRVSVINSDGVYYATLARHLADGQFVDGISGYWPPLYPALVAVASWAVSNLESAGRLVSVLFGAAAVVPAYLLARRLFDRRTALLAAGIVAVHPALIVSSTWVMTEAVYTFLLLSGMVIGWTALSRGGWTWFAATGVAFGLTYLTRPEAIGFALLFALLTVVLGTRLGLDAELRGRVARAAVTLAACAAVALPYVLVVHSKTDVWTISQKVDNNTEFGTAERGLALVDGARTTPMDKLFGSAFDVPAAAPVAPNSAAPPPSSQPARSHESRLRRLVRTTVENLGHQTRAYLPVVLPYPLLLCALVGLLSALAAGGWARHVYVLSFGLASVVGYSATVTELRYIFPLVPIAAGYLAFGVWTIAEGAAGLATRWRGNAARRDLVVTGAALATLALLAIALVPRYQAGFDRPSLQDSRLEEKAAGKWLHDHAADRGPLVMADNATVAFYAGGSNVFIPDEPFAAVLDYAHRRRVDYWVVSERSPDRTLYARPSAADLSRAGLQLVYDEAPAPGYAVQIYRVPH